jgi:S1-C subfamily serine protease
MTKTIKLCISIAALSFMVPPLSAQVAPPKRESRFHHLFSRHREADNLQQRFSDIKCALVLIRADNRLGTGFYINGNGDVATASHVLGLRSFSRGQQSQVIVSLQMPLMFFLTNSDGKEIQVPPMNIDFNPDAWLSDVALLRTGQKTNCWLREADDRMSKPGEHLIAMGFPGLSFGSLTIYTGIMSARLTASLPTALLDTGEPVIPPNTFVRVQMPISTGLSGAPVVDDENRVIAILTNAGGWTQDLDNLISLWRMKAFDQPPQPQPQPQQPGQHMVTLNSFSLTAELADLIHEYASPGYGDAVPLRYLRKQPQQIPTSSAPAH